MVTETRNSKKKKIGRVVSNKMVKTVVVMVEYYIPHRLYNKRVRHLSKFKAHDEQNACKIGLVSSIKTTSPILQAFCSS